MENRENTPRVCDGQCQKCPFIQQTYCSAVRLYNIMEQRGAIFSRLDNMSEAIARIEGAMRKLSPPQEVITPIAQGGDGADNRSPKKTNSQKES